jgi:hypothetical protein
MTTHGQVGDAPMTETLDRDTIVRALDRLSQLLGDRGITGEVCLLGGTVMVLAFKTRARTKDVDAIFHPPNEIRDAARLVQAEMNLPEGWLNDGAKAFVSTRHETAEGDLPQFPHLRLTAPTAEYMLAMKCMASRIPAGPEDQGDVADIAVLIRHLGLGDADQALSIVARYYPEEQIPVRARYLIEDLFTRMAEG